MSGNILRTLADNARIRVQNSMKVVSPSEMANLAKKMNCDTGFPFEKAVGIIEEGSGSHFDPKIVDSFLKAQDEIRAVAESKT